MIKNQEWGSREGAEVRRYNLETGLLQIIGLELRGQHKEVEKVQSSNSWA